MTNYYELNGKNGEWDYSSAEPKDDFDVDTLIASAQAWLDSQQTVPVNHERDIIRPVDDAIPVAEAEPKPSKAENKAQQGIYPVYKQNNYTAPAGNAKKPASDIKSKPVAKSEKTHASSIKNTQMKSSAANKNNKKRTKKTKPINPRLRRSIYLLFFPLAIFYMELIVIYRSYGSLLGWGTLYTLLFSVGIGLGCLFVVSLLNRKAAYIASIILTSAVFLIMCVQMIYYDIFQTFTVIAMIGMAGEAVTNFFRVMMESILTSILWIAALAVPVVLLVFFGKRVLPKKHNKPVAIVFILAACIIVTVFGSALVRANTSGIMSYRYVYDETFDSELSVQRFGILTTLRLEIRNMIWDKTGYVPPKYEEKFDSVKVENDEQSGNSDATGTAENNTGLEGLPGNTGASLPGLVGGGSGKVNEGQGGNTEISTPVHVDTSPNTLDIDFDAAGAKGGSTVASISDYLSSQKPTYKNEYTGMFKDYNLIYICAEGFSRYAVDETYTPTLYKLSHEGFVFNNFYNPLWGHSTSDGEFSLLTGLVPFSGNVPMKRTSNNNMYFSPGNAFTRAGYNTFALHNWTHDYYDRNLTHPNLGYDYMAMGDGIYFSGSSSKSPGMYIGSAGVNSTNVIDYSWPTSDYQLVDVTTDDYVTSQPFHTYYLTMSGHANYSFGGNNMAAKHRDDVANSGLSDSAAAYLACNMELDQAIQLLIERLQQAGVLDKTVIVICGDHYPYGLVQDAASGKALEGGYEALEELAGEDIEENFELYRSTLIIWNSQMGTIEVDKYCYSVDVLPTLYNLFGIEYDSRLLMGTDILSNSDPLVIFNNRSFITELGRFDSRTDTFIPNEGITVPSSYASEMFTVVKNKMKYSEMIIDNDYYSYLFD